MAEEEGGEEGPGEAPPPDAGSSGTGLRLRRLISVILNKRKSLNSCDLRASISFGESRRAAPCAALQRRRDGSRDVSDPHLRARMCPGPVPRGSLTFRLSGVAEAVAST